MSDLSGDLFGDDEPSDNEQQQQQVQDEQQQNGGDAAAAGLEDELEDDMGGGEGQQTVAAAAGVEDDDDALDADLFGSDEDDEAAAAAAEEAEGEPITVAAPLLPRPPAGSTMLLKMPNLIKVDPFPYDPAKADLEPELVIEGSKRRMRPNDINVIRWRYKQNEDGSLGRESNARYVQWSDGSESIVLGDEVLALDRKEQPRANTYVHVVRYDAIQGLAHVKQAVHLKPVSLDSKLHQRLKRTVQQATQRSDKVQVHLAARNPEVEKAEAEKRAEEMAKLRRSQARVAERTRMPKQRVPAFTAAYIEADDEDDEGNGYGGEEEDDYMRRGRDDDEAAARLQSAKRATPPPTNVRSSKQQRVEAASEEAEEEAEAAAAEAKPAAAGFKVRRGAILDDEDDD